MDEISTLTACFTCDREKYLPPELKHHIAKQLVCVCGQTITSFQKCVSLKHKCICAMEPTKYFISTCRSNTHSCNCIRDKPYKYREHLYSCKHKKKKKKT